MTEAETLNVLYQSDDNYAMVSAISIASLLENNRHLNRVAIYYCAYNVSAASRRKLQRLVDRYTNAQLTFVDAQKYHLKLQQLGVRPWHGVYVTWLKLLVFGDLRLTTDRVLFINGHTIINGVLDELIKLDFEGNVMALSYDCLTNEHKQTIGLAPTDGYYNCGIMLINHALWKNQKLSDYILDELSKKSDYVIADQDLCNVLFKGKIKTLSVTYNFSSAYYAYDIERLMRVNNLKEPYFYGIDEIMENYYSPKIIHSLFGINGKPWELDNQHPQRHLWEKYRKLTPWKDSPRPVAQRSTTRLLYKVLPNIIFMRLYIIAVKSRFV